MVNKFILCSVLLLVGITGSVFANSQGFSFPGNKEENLEQAPTRYFVKYLDGQEHEARVLITQAGLNIVDELPKEQVLVVEGDLEQVKALVDGSPIEYTEPVPIRNLLSQ